MTNEETLNLLKPIMLDGTEKVGDKVFHATRGYCEISQKITSKSTNTMLISIQYDALSFSLFMGNGFVSNVDIFPTLFKVNPFEWLNDQLFIEKRQNEMLIAELKDRDNSQERVIEAYHGKNGWVKRVLHCVKNGHAICWDGCESIDEAKDSTRLSTWTTWRELPTKITKEEALKMCEENGIDINDVILNVLAEKGVDTTNLIIE